MLTTIPSRKKIEVGVPKVGVYDREVQDHLPVKFKLSEVQSFRKNRHEAFKLFHNSLQSILSVVENVCCLLKIYSCLCRIFVLAI